MVIIVPRCSSSGQDRSRLLIRKEMGKARGNEQQLQISDSYESQQSSTSSLQHSQAISDFLLDVPENFELIYPLTSKKSDSITLTFNDVSCLEPDAFLNDNIIDFFLKYVHQELVADDLRDRIYIFNSFFYSRLTSRSNSFNNASNVDQPSTIGVGSAVAKKGEVSSSACVKNVHWRSEEFGSGNARIDPILQESTRISVFDAEHDNVCKVSKFRENRDF
uniref:Ubiquitin-like protease family profile domain-containing protein n=1 Tax=Romanomermis culicivorax TaxID=13658 RepID=A0A915L2E7_ROMCU